VWGGHSCPPLLSLGLFLVYLESKDKISAKTNIKNNVKGSGQECPLYTSKGKGHRDFLNGLYLMPAPTYSRTLCVFWA
jgi:hypothetical protein